jgi:hypothetical protein
MLWFVMTIVACSQLDEVNENVLVHEGKSYFLRTTPEYDIVVKEMDLSLEEAKVKAREALGRHRMFDRERIEEVLVRDVFFVDGDYLFPDKPRRKNDCPISGLRVNGITGKVSMDVTYESVSSADVPSRCKEVLNSLARERQKNTVSEKQAK